MFESKRRSKEEREKQSQEAVSRGWAIVGGQQLELIDDLFERYGVEGDAEPYEYTQVDVDVRDLDETEQPMEPVVDEPFPPMAPPPPGKKAIETESVSENYARQEIRSPLDEAQRRVVEALHSACTAWFGFFFRTLNGTDLERREIASRGLTNASQNLTKISKDLAEAPDLPLHLIEVASRYRTAIEAWSDAFAAVSRGMLLDQQHVANRGLDLMQQATETAEKAGLTTHVADSEATETFRFLDGLEPPAGASKSMARRAKEPWRLATQAASSTPMTARRSKRRAGSQ